MEQRKDREDTQDRKQYVKPELKEFGSIRDLTAGATVTGKDNDMSGGPIKT